MARAIRGDGIAVPAPTGFCERMPVSRRCLVGRWDPWVAQQELAAMAQHPPTQPALPPPRQVLQVTWCGACMVHEESRNIPNLYDRIKIKVISIN